MLARGSASLPSRFSANGTRSAVWLGIREHHQAAITLGLIGVAGLLALAYRLPELDRPGGNYDEGVYLQSLLLMRHGYRPFADIVSTQGVLYLDLAYLWYVVGGHTLSAARMGSVVASVVTLGAVGWAALAVGGRIAAVGAALALALSPTFLSVSRQALPEASAAALAALAVACAAQTHRDNRRHWRVAAGALLALACLVKPAVAPAALPVLLLTGRSLRRPSYLVAISLVVVTSISVNLVGGWIAVEQVMGWRLGARQIDLSAGVVLHNVDLLVDKMYRQEQPALYALAGVGAVWLLSRARVAGLAFVGWLLGQLVILLVYSNLSSHLGALLIPPLAVLAGSGIGAAWSAVSTRGRGTIPIVAAFVALAYLAAIPALLDRDRRVVEGELGTERGLTRTERSVVRNIERLTTPDDWVLTDAPYLAFLADRKVPPPMVDPSEARIESGALTEHEALRVFRDYDPEVVVFWTGKLGRMDGLVAAVRRDLNLVEEFAPIDDDSARAVYRDDD